MITEKAGYYDNIWREWLDRLPDVSWSGNEDIIWLEADFEKLHPVRQQELMEAMLHIVVSQGQSHWIALGVLEKRASLEQRREILNLYRLKLKTAVATEDEYYLCDLIRALSFEPTDEFLDDISDFYLNRKHGECYARPSVQLFKFHPDLYLKGWTRLFTDKPFDDWHDTAVVQFFFYAPDQIAALKLYMKENAPGTWKKLSRALSEFTECEPWGPSPEDIEKVKQLVLD